MQLLQCTIKIYVHDYASDSILERQNAPHHHAFILRRDFELKCANSEFIPAQDQKEAQPEFYITRIQMSKRNTIGDMMSGNVYFFVGVKVESR